MGEALSTRQREQARRLLLVAGLASFCVPGCSEVDETEPRADASPLDAAEAAAPADAPDAEIELHDGSGCAQWDAGAIPDPPVACGAVEACLPETEPCLETALRATLVPALRACTRCGELAIGMKGGCATAVVPMIANDEPATLRCLEQAILGHRWACAPADGWARLWIDSCTLP